MTLFDVLCPGTEFLTEDVINIESFIKINVSAHLKTPSCTSFTSERATQQTSKREGEATSEANCKLSRARLMRLFHK